jgi:4-amino-4-deoxy-L-arabinose transferase-like glycosyltransferase
VAVAIAAAIYLHQFGTVPFYIGGDEATLGIHAHSIATTGRDLNGRLLPLFINVEDPLPEFQGNRWWQPFLIYVTASILTVLPFAEWSVRLPLVLLALLNVALIFATARRLFPGVGYAMAAALFLVLTPTHLIMARQAADYFAVLTFTLVWLACLSSFLVTGRLVWAAAAGLALGIGVFSHISAWIIMPVHFLVSLVAVLRSKWPAARFALALAGGFAAPLLLLVPWLMIEPQTINETLGRYEVRQRDLTLLQSIRDRLNYENVQDKVAIYWNYFSPSLLFMTGGVHMAQATRQVGVFLMPVAVFLVVGLYLSLGAVATSSASLVLVAGLLLSPLAATLRGEGGYVARMLVMLPFALLIAVQGLAAMIRHKHRLVRAAAVVLLVAMPFQWVGFARGYFGDYQIHSAYWYDSMNFADVADRLIEADRSEPVPKFYLASNLDDAGQRWLFYLKKYGREDLFARSAGFDPANTALSAIPAGSLLVFLANDARLAQFTASGRCRVESSVTHIAGSTTAVILRC